jgi:Flp pilus assembly protein TadG
MAEGRWLGDERGTSTLEFIVVLPTLLLIFLGGLEFSRAWFTANVVTSAAREGARVAVVTSPVFDPGPAIARIGAVLGAANLTPTAVSVTCTPPPGQSGCVPDSQITATVTVNFATVVPAFLPMLASRPITGTTIMRRE